MTADEHIEGVRHKLRSGISWKEKRGSIETLETCDAADPTMVSELVQVAWRVQHRILQRAAVRQLGEIM
jgi:hypothetical protein